VRVAVTGATGYIGRSLVAALHERGHQVIALVRDPASARSRLPQGVELREWSLEGSHHEPLRGVDAIYHLAAFIPPDMADPAYAERCVLDNAIGTQRIVAAARAADVPRLIYFSTGQLYRWKDSPVNEEDAVDPSGRAPYYLGSKLLGEIFCRHAGKSGPEVLVLRLGSVYGPDMPRHATMQRMVDRSAAGKALSVANGGRYGVDFVLLDNVVQAAIMAAERKAVGVVNIGSGVRTTMAELARAITERFGGPEPRIEPLSIDDQLARGFPALDISRARRELAYIPTLLPEGLTHLTPSSR
jgi:UDP-glucose 4-epimerase